MDIINFTDRPIDLLHHWLVSSVTATLHNLLLGHISLLCRCCLLLQSVAWSICLSVGLSVTILSPVKRLNRSGWRLGCGLGWTPKRPKPCTDGGPYPPREGAILRGKRYLHGELLTKRSRSTILLQQNPSFGYTPDRVRFNCRKLCQSDKIRCTYLVINYELFERPSYY